MSEHAMPVEHLVLLLNHYTSPNTPCRLFPAPRQVKSLEDLALMNLVAIRQSHEGGPIDVSLTDRGRVYIDMLLATPLPVAQWTDPRKAPNAA